METEREEDIDPELRHENSNNAKIKESSIRIKRLLSKKFAVWIIAAGAALVLGTAYLFFIFPEAEEGSFAGKIFKPFLAENMPFVEGNPFFFPSSRDKKMVYREKGKKTTLNEAPKRSKSTSPDWWLNSGGIMLSDGKEFSTNLGPLPKDHSWRKLYAKTNSRDTDDGYYPQNIFRLVTRDKWKNFSQSVYFNVEKVNMSQSNNRNESNGILLFNRYQDGDNLYYTGVRVDGGAVIKKKIKDKYYTLKEKKIFAAEDEYDKENNPNFIPTGSWIGIKSEVKTLENDTVEIKFYIDREQKGEWQLVLETKDIGGKQASKPFLQEGYAGIRTDFMDVKFENYSIQKL